MTDHIRTFFEQSEKSLWKSSNSALYGTSRSA